MLRDLVMFGAGWFVYTKTGRKTLKNIYANCLPLIEKELAPIMEPLKELVKDPTEVKDARESKN